LSTEISGIRPDIRAGYFSNIRQIRYPVGYEKALSGAPLIFINGHFKQKLYKYFRPGSWEKATIGALAHLCIIKFNFFLKPSLPLKKIFSKLKKILFFLACCQVIQPTTKSI
jgi:hypothetical protein